MSRCKDANCNAILQPYEIIWYEDEQRHEEFCTTCRNRALEDEINEGLEGFYYKPIDYDEV